MPEQTDRLKQIRERLDAATPGPWTCNLNHADGEQYDERRLDERDWDSANGGIDGATRAVLIPWDYEGYSAGAYIRAADAAFIAAAPSDVAWLLGEVESLRAALTDVVMLFDRGPVPSKALDAARAALEPRND